jgi:hypothetical protein
VPLVLCCLEGRTSADAAREIGCPVGTVESRLARARCRLAAALARRGVAAAAGLLAAAVPAGLATSTATAAARVAAGDLAAAGVVPARVAALTEGALRALTITKLKTVAGALLAVALAGTWAGLFAFQAAGRTGPGRRGRPRRPPTRPWWPG